MTSSLSDIKTTRLTASGAVFAGPARVKAISYVASAVAGTIQVRDGGAGGTVIATFDTPASATFSDEILIAGSGMLCKTDCYVTLTNVSFATIQYA